MAHEIVELTGRPKEEFMHFFPPNATFAYQIPRCEDSIECIPRFVATIVHGSEQYRIAECSVRDTVAQLKAAVGRAITGRHPSFGNVSELILSNGPDGVSVYQDNTPLADLPRQLFVPVGGFELTFKHGRVCYRQRFDNNQTVEQARLYIAVQLALPTEDIILSYWGKELRDGQPLRRLPLRPGKCILVFENSWDEEQTLDRATEATKAELTEFRFYERERDDHFTVSLLPTDLMDRARIYVADRYQVPLRSVVLSFDGVTLFNDTMIGQIAFGENGEIEVTLNTRLGGSRSMRRTATNSTASPRTPQRAIRPRTVDDSTTTWTNSTLNPNRLG
jgi:hypothetical protein